MTNNYTATNAAGQIIVTRDLWEAVKHCDPELNHNSMEDAESGKPMTPNGFKDAPAGTRLAVCISTRKRYARKFDREILGTIWLTKSETLTRVR